MDRRKFFRDIGIGFVIALFIFLISLVFNRSPAEPEPVIVGSNLSDCTPNPDTGICYDDDNRERRVGFDRDAFMALVMAHQKSSSSVSRGRSRSGLVRPSTVTGSIVWRILHRNKNISSAGSSSSGSGSILDAIRRSRSSSFEDDDVQLVASSYGVYYYEPFILPDDDDFYDDDFDDRDYRYGRSSYRYYEPYDPYYDPYYSSRDRGVVYFDRLPPGARRPPVYDISESTRSVSSPSRGGSSVLSIPSSGRCGRGRSFLDILPPDSYTTGTAGWTFPVLINGGCPITGAMLKFPGGGSGLGRSLDF